MRGWGKLYLNYLPSKSGHCQLQMSETQLKIRICWLTKREQVQRFSGRTGCKPWKLSLEPLRLSLRTSTLLLSMTSPLGRPSPQEGRWQLQTSGSAPSIAVSSTQNRQWQRITCSHPWRNHSNWAMEPAGRPADHGSSPWSALLGLPRVSWLRAGKVVSLMKKKSQTIDNRE